MFTTNERRLPSDDAVDAADETTRREKTTNSRGRRCFMLLAPLYGQQKRAVQLLPLGCGTQAGRTADGRTDERTDSAWLARLGRREAAQRQQRLGAAN